MRPIFLLSSLLLLLGLAACKAPDVTRKQADVVSHDIWDGLLKQHVSADGFVDYQGFLADSSDLHTYLNLLSDNPPAKNWSKGDEMAYWINAYNAFTVAIIVRNYPVKSIKDIGPKRTIPFVNTVWDIKFVPIGDEMFDLNNLEHAKLRKQFHDPRIHFAVNCASYSCPPLRAEAYVGDRLDAQLDEQGQVFVNDGFRNIVQEDKLQLSKIFSWYGMDFKDKDTTVKDWIRKYTQTSFKEDAEVEFIEYDWSLNEQK